ncbi:uncharacterized protein LOC144425631 [Styela clava]
MNLKILVILFSILITSVSAQDPWKKECVDGFELLFYKQGKTYEKAKTFCERLGGYLAKVDNERMTTVINSAFDLQNMVNTFYIGGNDIAIEEDWKWQDGTNVIMRGEVGYQNWYSNEPNNFGNEDCLAVGKKTYEWIDISCDEIIYYICQKVFPGPFVRIQTINGNQKRCSATECSAVTQVDWYKSSNKVSTATTSRVYQTLQNGSAILNLQNANIADAGSYSCRYRIGKTEKNTTESYEVAGNPTIQQISNNVCNSNLIISWQPHTNAVGFPHKIEVSPTSGESTKWLDSPTPEKQSTTITNLSPTTTFQIKITACVTKDNCPTQYSTIRSARTGGSKLSVESSSIIQYKNTQTCVISWILYNKTETGDSYIVELNLTSTPVSSLDANSEVATKLIEVTTSSGYSFQPEPNRNYSASIKIFNCYWSVIGSCVGKPKEKKSFELNIVIFVIGFLIPLIFYVIFGLIIYRLINKIKKLKKHAEAKEHNYENIQEKATPSNDPVSQPSYSNVLQETAGYEQALPAPTKQTQVESAYEQLSSSNVLQEAAGYEQALPAPTKQTQVESAYEQPSSSNVLQEAAGYKQALSATTMKTRVETAYETYNA